MQIDLKADLRGLTRSLNAFQREQVPFAAAQALTAVARNVAKAETDQLSKTFSHPTPFTQKAFTVRGARKSNLTATIFAKDRQSDYLAPYLDHGLQFLGNKQAILTPINIPLNTYGNIPRGKLQSLKGQPDFFVGEIRGIYGLWQRMKPPTAGKRHRGFVAQKRHLRLLIDFTKPRPVTKTLPYADVARATVDHTFRAEFASAIARALATAR